MVLNDDLSSIEQGHLNVPTLRNSDSSAQSTSGTLNGCSFCDKLASSKVAVCSHLMRRHFDQNGLKRIVKTEIRARADFGVWLDVERSLFHIRRSNGNDIRFFCKLCIQWRPKLKLLRNHYKEKHRIREEICEDVQMEQESCKENEKLFSDSESENANKSMSLTEIFDLTRCDSTTLKLRAQFTPIYRSASNTPSERTNGDPYIMDIDSDDEDPLAMLSDEGAKRARMRRVTREIRKEAAKWPALLTNTSIEPVKELSSEVSKMTHHWKSKEMCIVCSFSIPNATSYDHQKWLEHLILKHPEVPAVQEILRIERTKIAHGFAPIKPFRMQTNIQNVLLCTACGVEFPARFRTLLSLKSHFRLCLADRLRKTAIDHSKPFLERLGLINGGSHAG